MDTRARQSGPPVLRLAHPLAFAAFLKHVGAPAERLLRRHGLAVYCDDPDEFVPLRRAWSFLDAVANSEDLEVGWHVGRYVGDHNLSRKLLRQLESAPTVYEAIKRLVRLARSDASHLQLGIVERRRDILLFTHYSVMKGEAGYTPSQSYQLGIFVDLIRHFVGKNWVPEEIGIENPSVPNAAEELFPGCRIMTQQRVGYIAVPRSRLHVASCGASFESDREDSPVLTKDRNYAETLGALIHPYLRGGYPSARLAASLVDTSVRTLARRLSACGTTYGEVIDHVRFKEAKKLLQDTEMRVTDVGIEVGFDDPANFARMFRRISGLSPRHFRRAVH